jgi:hypothetical protein
MAFPAAHKYMTVIGEAYAGAERWQFGLRLQGSTGDNEAVGLALAPVVEHFWRGDIPPYSTGDALFPVSSHSLSELKVATIGEDGEYAGSTVAYSHFYLPTIPGPGTPHAGMVPQATVCVSLLTAVPRGLASKGRIYLPHTFHTLAGADGRLAASSALAMANAVRSFITAINATPGAGTVAIFSRGKGVPSSDTLDGKVHYTYPTVGASNAVTATRCGRVVDTQRRRRRSLAEAPVLDTVI